MRELDKLTNTVNSIRKSSKKRIKSESLGKDDSKRY